jgi:flagellar biosynthesis protein FlhB
MKEINWKSLSFSLIISTILNGTVLSIFLIQYVNTVSSLFHEILSHINNSNMNNSKNSVTIAYGQPPIPVWAAILIFSMSYIFVTMISYLLIESLNRRKK